MKKALEGLSGVTKVEMDLVHDLFRVTRSSDVPTPAAILDAVRLLNYEPRVATAGEFHVHDEPLHPVGAPAEVIRAALAKAKAAGKRFVLVDCMGDN